MRTQGTTSLLIRNLLPQLAALPDDGRVDARAFLSGNHLFFLNLAMAAAKSVAMWAEQVRGSEHRHDDGRNGTSYGIRLAGSDEVFVSDAPAVGGRDVLPRLRAGDECARHRGQRGARTRRAGRRGRGRLARGRRLPRRAWPTPSRDRADGGDLRRPEHPVQAAHLDYRGTPVGVDVRRVVELDTTPKVTTGILHASSGIGQIGAGVATAPIECFRAALRALAPGRPEA